MYAAEPRVVAGFMDASAVSRLWEIVGRGLDGRDHEAGATVFPPLLHIPTRAEVFRDDLGTVHSVMGTWYLENLLDYLRSSPGRTLPDGYNRPESVCVFGLDGAFPSPFSVREWTGKLAVPEVAFLPVGAGAARSDDAYFQILLDWWLQEADRPGFDDRERDNALTAARFAETWRDSSTPKALAALSAYEFEMRARRMGMVVADSFTRSFSWCRALIGPEAMRAFNDLVAWWAVATLMPRPFRLGLLDRCFASPALCGVLLAANATAANLGRAAAQRFGTPNRFPFDGVAYAAPDGVSPPGEVTVQKVVGDVHGMPVFVPIPEHPAALWEMIVAVRLEEVTSATSLPLPTLPAVQCLSATLPVLIVRIGESGVGAADGQPLVEAHYLHPETSCGELAAAAADDRSAARLVDLVSSLWRVQN